MEEKKLKVAFVCIVSNEEIRKKLRIRKYFSIKNLIKRLLGKKTILNDSSIWNTLSLREFEKYDDIEMHAIIPHPYLYPYRQDFAIRGVYYHCFRDDQEEFPMSIFIKKKNIFNRFKHNNDTIINIINEIKPDLINMCGAEGPFFNLSGLKIDTHKIPFILTMQTVMSDPDFIKYYPIDEKSYNERTQVEQALFKHSNYIAAGCRWFRKIVKEYNPNVTFLYYYFCTPSYEIAPHVEKEFDFAYWAANIVKAGEDAVEAFARAYRRNPTLTLNIIGGYSDGFKSKLDGIIEQYGITKAVTFSGYMPTNEEALRQAAKSRFALVPIKIDIVSSTIREAMRLGMPVVTFITRGTPYINEERETILLSEIGDYDGMANNMLRLVSDESFANKLKENGMEFCSKYFDNERNVDTINKMYHAVYEHFHQNIPIPEEVTRADF